MTDLLKAVTILANLATVAAEVASSAQVVSQLITRVQTEGRASFTAEEWKVIEGLDVAARARLEAAIQKAGG